MTTTAFEILGGLLFILIILATIRIFNGQRDTVDDMPEWLRRPSLADREFLEKNRKLGNVEC
jgi:hypothetical protein